jgi:hypothetical protein
MPLYLMNIDGVKIPLVTDDQGRIVISPTLPLPIAVTGALTNGELRSQPVNVAISDGCTSTVSSQIQAYDGAAWQNVRIDGNINALRTIDYLQWSALEGGTICRWVNEKVPGNAQVVLTDGPAGNQPGIYYNLTEGQSVLIAMFCMELVTLSDNVKYELGFTDAAAGAGTFTPITPARYLRTGAAATSFDGYTTMVVPAAPVTYASGARSITFRVTCNDAGATITPAWHGVLVQS